MLTITVTDHANNPGPQGAVHVLGHVLGLVARARRSAAPWDRAFTHAHMPIEDSVPASNPQKPPACVARFHNMPSITVPNSGAMKKLNSACT